METETLPHLVAPAALIVLFLREVAAATRSAAGGRGGLARVRVLLAPDPRDSILRAARRRALILLGLSAGSTALSAYALSAN